MHANRSYLIVGLGVTGLSVVDYLVQNNARVMITDTRAAPPQLQELQHKYPQLTVMLGAITIPEHITHIVLSPGLGVATPEIQAALQHGVKVLGDIELFAQAVDKPVIAITGANGKSTVTTLLGEMARASGLRVGVGGNLGPAALTLLKQDYAVYILELSSFQLETTHSLQPQGGAVLNISPDHLDRYAGMAEYIQAKQRIYNRAEYIVFNQQDEFTMPIAGSGQQISFGLEPAAANNFGIIMHDGAAWLARGTTPLLPISAMAMLGIHNVANALAALAMGELAGFNMSAMLNTLRSFKGLEHRCEKIVITNGVLWVNDSKGTNVASTLAAIRGLATQIAGKWVIILGGVGKMQDFSPLLPDLEKVCKAAILIGTEAANFARLLDGKVPYFMAADLAAVVAIAKQQTQPGDGVLLSPACASFDMFDNYVQRGRLFKQQVLQEVGTYGHQKDTIS